MFVSEMELNKDRLFGSHSSDVTSDRKCTEWLRVAAAVNAVSENEYEAEDSA